MSELPTNWHKAKFTEVFDVQGGTQPPKSTFLNDPTEGYVRLLQIRDFGAKPVPTYIQETKSIKTCEKDDLLIARYGASLGRICTGMSGAYNVALAKLVCPVEVSKAFAKHYLCSEEFQAPLRLLSRSAQNGFNKEDLSDFDFSFPPKAEQTRIAQKLDELLAQVETLRARIDAIPTLLKRFRQSILSAAVSGRLLGNAECWHSTRIGDICIVSTGKTPKRDILNYWEHGDIPWLTSAVTGEDFCSKAEQFVTEFALKDCSLKMFQPGTLLMAMYGEGKTRGQVTELKISATCNQACAAITVNETIARKEFVKIRLQENYEEIRKQAVGGAQPNLNLNKVREISISLPSLEEQTEIVRRVEQLFAFADQLETKVASAKNRIDHLTQSILAKAFRGELVPQDPNDEPASALLERIKGQRAAAPNTKRGRKSA
ncbi:restriction endonuclease subunit S [Pseudomonas fluorescens]|uniref:Type I restriction modification DNA specificity domain-containing protein n=1 Tax=Pseudomonas fluorescens TaxID=294 RepID=A0A5E6VTR0_PSEFL|nr:restriction endonuclease subunit S [Pseudomonas fluorescens]VVN21375.1 hypothetical protein PS659_04392 [Pseudomonas fluorescens]